MNDITKIKVDGEPGSRYQLYPRNEEFAKRAGSNTMQIRAFNNSSDHQKITLDTFKNLDDGIYFTDDWMYGNKDIFSLNGLFSVSKSYYDYNTKFHIYISCFSTGTNLDIDSERAASDWDEGTIDGFGHAESTNNSEYGTFEDYFNHLIDLRIGKDVILNSSTVGSTKKFKITVDDSGALTATEVT